MTKIDKNRPPKRTKTGGRVKGVPNKTTRQLKEAILEAAKLAGDRDGLVGYLRGQAENNPGPFLALLGKVLPHTITGPDGGPLQAVFKTVYEHNRD